MYTVTINGLPVQITGLRKIAGESKSCPGPRGTANLETFFDMRNGEAWSLYHPSREEATAIYSKEIIACGIIDHKTTMADIAQMIIDRVAAVMQIRRRGEDDYLSDIADEAYREGWRFVDAEALADIYSIPDDDVLERLRDKLRTREQSQAEEDIRDWCDAHKWIDDYPRDWMMMGVIEYNGDGTWTQYAVNDGCHYLLTWHVGVRIVDAVDLG